MKRTISLKLILTKDQSESLLKTQEVFVKDKQWFFNLVLDIPDVPLEKEGGMIAVDMGENNMATTSNGIIHGGGKLRYERDKFLNRRKFVEYKAQPEGIAVVYVNPAYTSQTCSVCSCLGSRHKHLFKCLNCGSYQHSDCNAAINLLKLGESTVSPMAFVNMPMVATALPLVTSFRL